MTTGNFDSGWSGGATNRGVHTSRTWNGADATATEKSSGIYLPHAYSTTRTWENSPRISYANKLSNPNAFFDAWAFAAFGKPTLTDPWTSNDSNALINKLYAEVKGSDFNAAVFGAQFGQTIGGIGDAALRIGSAWRQARKGNFAAASKALTGRARGPDGKLASNWLELQYGWLPLLGDVDSSMQLLANQRYRSQPPKIKVRMRKKASDIYPTHGYWTVDTQRLIHQEQYIFEPYEALTFSQVLGLNDPYSVVWELLPYSFVLDWFLPIGPWLEAAAASRALKGRFVHTKVIRKTFSGLHSGSVYTIVGGENYFYHQIELKRTLPTTLSPKIPHWRPFGEVTSSLTRCLNALALLANLKR